MLGILFYCYEFFLRISPSVVMGQLMQYFNLDALGLTKLLAIYYLAYALGQIPAGLLLDRFSLRLMLAISAFLCSVGTLIFISSHNVLIAECGRFFIGFVSSFAFVGALKMGEVYLPSRYFTRLVGVVIALGTIMASYGNILLAYFVQTFAWTYLFHWIAFMGLGISGLFVFAYWRFPKHTPKPENARYRLQDVRVLLQSRFLWINAIIGGLFYLPTAVLSDVWGNAFLHATYHIDFVATSKILSFMFIGWVVGSPIMGMLADYLQNPRLVMAGGVVLTLIVLCMLFQGGPLVTKHLSFTLFLFGVFGSAQLVVWKLFHQHATFLLAATGIALTNMIITLTTSIGQFSMGIVLNKFGHSHDLSSYAASDYHHALFWLALPLVIVGLTQAFYTLRKQ